MEKKRHKKKLPLFPAGLEPATFRVLGGRDNHYTTETIVTNFVKKYIFKHFKDKVIPSVVWKKLIMITILIVLILNRFSSLVVLEPQIEMALVNFSAAVWAAKTVH